MILIYGGIGFLVGWGISYVAFGTLGLGVVLNLSIGLSLILAGTYLENRKGK